MKPAAAQQLVDLRARRWRPAIHNGRLTRNTAELRHRRDEPVAGPRDRFDEARRTRIVGERFPQRGDVNREDALFHVGVRPDLLQENVTRQQPPCVADERHQQIVRFRRQRSSRSVAGGQPPLGNIECEPAEGVLLLGAHRELAES
jgi:hypothetical protein